MTLDPNDPEVEVDMDIPTQPGLAFDVNLNLQNDDELHLCAGSLWVEWFPCVKPEVEEAFLDAVRGVLSGRYRIVETLRGDRAILAKLQRPEADDWVTIATWSTLHLPIPWRKTTRVLRNRD